MSPQHLATARHAHPIVPLGGPQPVVIDTNVLFSDLVRRIVREQDTVLVRAAEVGAIRIFAASHVCDEVYERAPTQERRGVSPVRLIREFECRYLPLIQFVDRDVARHPRTSTVDADDVDDVPTAELALLVPGALVYSEDPDLVQHGFGREDWLTLTWHAEEIFGVDAALWMSALLMRIGVQRARQVAGALWSAARTGPGSLTFGLALGACAFELSKPGRTASAHAALRPIGFVLSEIVVGYGQLAVHRDRAAQALWAAAVAPDELLGLEQRAAAVLARSVELESSQLAARLSAHGHPVSVQRLDRALCEHRAFVRGARGWTVGKRRGFATAAPD